MSSHMTSTLPAFQGTLFLDKSALHALSFAKCAELAKSFNFLVTDVLMNEMAADVIKYPCNQVHVHAAKVLQYDLRFSIPFPELVVRSLCGQDILMKGVPVTSAHPKPDSAECTYRELLSRISRCESTPADLTDAEEWNRKVNALDPCAHQKAVQQLFVDCNMKDDPHIAVDKLLRDSSKTALLIGYLKDLVRIPDAIYARILKRLSSAPLIPIADMANYAAFVLRSDLYFHFALAAGTITTKRNNRVDHMYCFYLPFCKLFLTSDETQCQFARLFCSPWQTVKYLSPK